MKIQEMKSGTLHFNKRTEIRIVDDLLEMQPIETVVGVPEFGENPDCELDEASWSVISFDKKHASGLTYRQAVELMSVLDSNSVPGLCIITDEAALRIKS